MDDTQEMVDVLYRRFPKLHPPPTDDICYATQNRQAAVKAAAADADLVLVIGAANSSNSNRLVEVAAARGVAAHRIESAAELEEEWFGGVGAVAITAGASAPEYLVQDVITHLQERYGAVVEGGLEATDEDVYFPLPHRLKRALGPTAP